MISPKGKITLDVSNIINNQIEDHLINSETGQGVLSQQNGNQKMSAFKEQD